ncbi:hypothetical protein SAMN05444747_11128 [Variovorax sp. OV329]|nr:hypothetical protein SAMN05444747_11128 [Variovorax sp. OV329]
MKGLRHVISVPEGAHICSSCEGVCTVQTPSKVTLQEAESWSSVGFTQSRKGTAGQEFARCKTPAVLKKCRRRIERGHLVIRAVASRPSATLHCTGMPGANAIEGQCVSAQARTSLRVRMSGTPVRPRGLHGANPSRSKHLYPGCSSVRGERGGGAKPSDRPCLLLGFAPCKPFLTASVRRRQRPGQGGFNLPGCLRQKKQWQEEFRNGK